MHVSNYFEKHNKVFIVIVLLIALFSRVAFVPKWPQGDLFSFAEWGKQYWKLGITNFYLEKDWKYSVPNYPPLASHMYGGLYWFYDHKHVLAQLHNQIKIPPAAFIQYFDKNGYFLLLKLPPILADFGLGIIIYMSLLRLTGNKKKTLAGMTLYLLNPVTIFLSGIWGQAESLIAFLGLLSFITLVSKKEYLSVPLLFASMYIKPSWAIFIPFYVFVLWQSRPNLLRLSLGLLLTIGIFVLSTMPFAPNDMFKFSQKIYFEKISPTSRGTAKASVSAFNIHAAFFKLDKDFDDVKFLIIPAKHMGTAIFFVINLFTFAYYKKQKDKTFAVISGIFIIGMGSFLFLTSMLERYFFPAFASMIILMFAKPRVFLWLLAMNLILFLNLVFSFFRRTSDEIGHPFTNYNFFLIRVLSIINILGWWTVVKRLGRDH